MRAITGSIALVVFFYCATVYLNYFWVLLVPIGSLILFLFGLILISNVAFWIKNRGEYSKPYLPVFIDLFALVVVYYLIMLFIGGYTL